MLKLFHNAKRYVFFYAAFGFAIVSCSKNYGMEGEYVVASKQGCYWYEDRYHPYYLVRERASTTWNHYERIEGLDYAPGYEYHIYAEKVLDEEMVKHADSSNAPYLKLLKVLSSEQKETSGLPSNILYYSDDLEPPGQ